MWYLIQGGLVICVGLFIITQIIIPAFMDNVKYFWVFNSNWNHQMVRHASAQELQEAENALAEATKRYTSAIHLSGDEMKKAQTELDVAQHVETEARKRKEELDAVS